jgi:hypothetical protein
MSFVLRNGPEGGSKSWYRPRGTLIACGAYREAARMFPDELIELRQGARIIEKSKS